MNVYYLPARATETRDAIDTPVTRWSVARARLARAFWRARLTVAEMWAIARRGGARSPFDDRTWFAEEDAMPRRRALGPARILDFESARQRRALARA